MEPRAFLPLLHTKTATKRAITPKPPPSNALRIVVRCFLELSRGDGDLEGDADTVIIEPPSVDDTLVAVLLGGTRPHEEIEADETKSEADVLVLSGRVS